MRLYGFSKKNLEKIGYKVIDISLPDGDSSKDIEIYKSIIEKNDPIKL